MTFVLLSLQAICNLLLPNYMSNIVDIGIMRNDTEYLFSTGIQMVLITIAGSVTSILVCLFSARIASGIACNLRRDLFNKIEFFSHYEFDKFSASSLTTRCTNDVTQIQSFLLIAIRFIWFAPIIAAGGFIMAEIHGNGMGWIIALPVLLLLGIIILVFAISMPKFYSLQGLVDRLYLISRENLTGMMVIRAFNACSYEKSRFDKANGNLTRAILFTNRTIAVLPGALMFIMNASALLIVWVFAKQIAESRIQAGDMIAFIQYTTTIIMAFVMLSMIFIMMPRAQVSANRIAEVLKTDPKIKDPPHPLSFDSAQKGILEFRNVCFRYPNAEQDALSNINFTLSPGKTTAIIGSTGAGKSSITYLALRFYDVTSGAIYVDGRDIRTVTQNSLRGKIAYVPQNSVLLSGTIKSNINYGKNYALPEEEILSVADTAQAMEFIMENPVGIEAPILQGGVNVSGGQKQRLAIARAIAKKSEILIFDDSFSALDFKTDAALRKKLREKESGASILIIAQRISAIKNADEILVLENGKITGRGVHDELMKTCPEYAEIAETQFAES